MNFFEEYLNTVGSANFAYSRNFEDFRRRLDVYIERHGRNSEFEFDGLDSVMNSLNFLSCIYAKIIDGIMKPDSPEASKFLRKNCDLLNRCLREAKDRFNTAFYELFLIDDAIDSRDVEVIQMALFRLGYDRDLYPVWPERQLQDRPERDVRISEDAS